MKAFLIFSILFTIETSKVFAISPKLSAIDTCRIPTLITPNDDGQNDDFVIPCLPTNKNDNQSELYIFNEWGDRVAYFKPYLNDWSGTYSSKPLPDGTYFYIFRFNPSKAAQRGYVTIFR
jgi:gliding motility-associated-like protein